MTDRNKNRPGYKETNVGWIPKEWSVPHLKDIAEINPESLGSRTDDNYEFYYIDLTGVKSGKIDLPKDRIRFCDSPSRARIVVQKGDVLLATVRPNLKGFGYIDFKADEHVCSTGFAVIRCDGKCNGRYIYQSLYSDQSARYFYGCVVGTGYPALNSSDVNLMKLPLPPLPEQEKIAEVLSCWDEGIEGIEKLIDAKKLRKKGLMQQLLTGEKRLPGFQRSEDGGQRTEHRFFSIPSDWKLPQIKEVAKECTERNKTGEPVTVLSCSKHRGFVESSQYFGKQVFSDDTANYKIIRRGEFGFPSNHIEEGSIGLLTTHDKGIVSPIYTVFKTNSQMLPEYLIALFKTETYRHIFEITTNGSVDRRGSLRWNDFKLIKIPQPSLEEQKAIAAVLETADEEIRLLEAERDALIDQKKGLMQKLLTGEIRMPEFRTAC